MASPAKGPTSRETVPLTPEFEASVSALVLTRASDSAGGIPLVTPRRMALPGSMAPSVVTGSSLTLLHDGAPSISLTTLCERLAKAFVAVHGSAGYGLGLARDVAAVLLGIATLVPPRDRLAALNDLLRNVSTARVGSWLVLPETDASSDQYSIDNFTYARVDAEKLRASWERAGANDWARYRDSLVGRRAIWRVRDVLLLDPYRFSDGREPSNAGDGSVMFALMDALFRRVAAGEHAIFGEDLDRAQRVVRAAGLGGIPRESFLQMGAFAMRVTVFTREARRRGWVVPQGLAPLVQTVSPRVLREGAALIRTALALEDGDSRPLDPVIDRYAQYLVRARDDLDQDPASSVLHLIFGLDYLLGGAREQPLTATLASRVAMLAGQACGQTIAQIEKRMTELYDARSGYVHRGGMDETVDVSARDELFRFAFACLGAAFHARRQDWAGPDPKTARDAWLSRIDLAVQHARVRGDADAQALADLGVARIELVDEGACRVRLR